MGQINPEEKFRTALDELILLNHEITEIKAFLRDLSLKISRIEQHAKRAFPNIKPSPIKESLQPSRVSKLRKELILTRENAMAIFEELRESFMKYGHDAVAARLSKDEVETLVSISQELGLPTGKKPSRTRLIKGIIGRIRESVLLGMNPASGISKSLDQSE
ncbi:MAG: hypothetical protein HRF51_13455 [bacterium]|jgi:hypothetical protein